MNWKIIRFDFVLISVASNIGRWSSNCHSSWFKLVNYRLYRETQIGWEKKEEEFNKKKKKKMRGGTWSMSMTMTLFRKLSISGIKTFYFGNIYLFRILSQSIQHSLLQCPLKKEKPLTFTNKSTTVLYYIDSHLSRWIRNMFVSLVEIYSWTIANVSLTLLYFSF